MFLLYSLCFMSAVLFSATYIIIIIIVMIIFNKIWANEVKHDHKWINMAK